MGKIWTNEPPRGKTAGYLAQEEHFFVIPAKAGIQEK